MQTPYRQQWRLWRIERTLRRSDPRLAAMLGIFAQLYSGELLSSSEQEPGIRRRAWLLAAVIRLAIWLTWCAAALSHVAGAAWRAARGRPRTTQHSGARAA